MNRILVALIMFSIIRISTRFLKNSGRRVQQREQENDMQMDFEILKVNPADQNNLLIKNEKRKVYKHGRIQRKCAILCAKRAHKPTGACHKPLFNSI